MIFILFAICLIALALFGPRAWADPMRQAMFPWICEWFENGKAMIGAPNIAFKTHDACVEFAAEHVAIAAVMGVEVTFACKLGPFIEA